MDKHHIIPRYMGGSNRKDNLVEISRTCHIMWHYANFRLWGNKEDYVAYRGLSGTLSGDELNRAKSQLAGLKNKRENKGYHKLTKEEKQEFGRVGGKIGGKIMANYIWITNGTENSRLPKDLEIPEGWERGVTRKKPRKNNPKYGKRADWVKIQREKSKTILEERARSLKKYDLSAWGALTALAKEWGVSRTQAKKCLEKIRVQGIEP